MLDDFDSAFPDSGVRRKRGRGGVAQSSGAGAPEAATAAADRLHDDDDNAPEVHHISSGGVIADANRRVDDQGKHTRVMLVTMREQLTYVVLSTTTMHRATNSAPLTSQWRKALVDQTVPT
jgi:hypothetical protein